MACSSDVFKKVKIYLATISLQFGYAGMYIVTTLCLKRGMNHFVLSVYRHIFATIAIAPFALVLERKIRPKMTLPIFLRIMLLGLIEPVIDQNLYYVGLKYTSATFASASTNVLPAITFIMATIFRLEKVDIRKIPSQAKIVGTIITVSGAMLMTIYKGPVVDLFMSGHRHHHDAAAAAAAAAAASASSSVHWIAGTLMLLGSCVGWAGFFILQSYTLEMYPAQLSMTALICVLGAAQGTVVTFVFNRDLSSWALGWDSRLLASLYTGVVNSGVAYYIQGVVNRERGPVFITAFSPLCMIITAALGAIILAEQLHLGSILGAIIIITGLYCVIWGKSKDKSSSQLLAEEKSKGQDLPIITTDISTTKGASNIIVDHDMIADSNNNNNNGISVIKIMPPTSHHHSAVAP